MKTRSQQVGELRGGRRRSRQDGDGKNVEKRTARLAVRSSVYTIAVAHRFGEEEEADDVGWLDTCLGKLIKHLSIIFVASVMGNRNGARRKHPPLLVPHSRFASPLFSYPFFFTRLSFILSCSCFRPLGVEMVLFACLAGKVWRRVCLHSVSQRMIFFLLSVWFYGWLEMVSCVVWWLWLAQDGSLSLLLSVWWLWLAEWRDVHGKHLSPSHSLCQAPVSWKCSVACQHVLH